MGRERKRVQNIDVREKHPSYQEYNLQPRYVPWPGIELAGPHLCFLTSF